MIGNTELAKEKYADVKKKLLAEIVDEIEKEGNLDFGILNLKV